MAQAERQLLKVLICDDDPVDRKLIRSYLGHIEDREFVFVEAGSQEEIRDALERHSIDLILLDVQMPDKSGMEWLTELRQTQMAPVVMVTGFGTEDIAAESIQEGATGYLAKAGLSKERLQSAIDKALSRWQQERQSKADQEELERLALHDALTGLLNRRAILGRLDDRQKHARRYEEDLSVLVLDIDHFKSVNDGYGHLAGDGVLVMLAECLLQSVREVDAVGRLGGEEFLVVLPRTGSQPAVAVAERVKKAVAAQRVSAVTHVELSVTVSIGVATYRQGEDISSLVARADAAMYEAKRSGRNAVRHAP